MSKLEPHQERLQSYLDGELDSTRRAELEAELARDAGSAENIQLLRLERLRQLLADAPAGLAAPDPGELAFERVRKNIHAALAPETASTAGTTASSPAGAIVIPLRATTAKPTRPVGRWVIGGAMALAAAAAVALLVSKAPGAAGPGAGVGSVASHDPGTRTSPDGQPRDRANRLNGTEIVRVEFGKMSGTYWEQSEGDDRVAVVWIDDTVLEEVGRQ